MIFEELCDNYVIICFDHRNKLNIKINKTEKQYFRNINICIFNQINAALRLLYQKKMYKIKTHKNLPTPTFWMVVYESLITNTN